MNPGHLPDPAQVQRPVVHPYRFHCSRHFFFRVADAGAGRQFVQALVEGRWVTDASLPDADLHRNGDTCALNIGFTYSGLAALGLPKPYLRVFQEKAKAFAEGPNLRATRRLADTGPSAVQWWEPGFQHGCVHVYIVLHADSKAQLDQSSAALGEVAGAAALHAVGPAIDGEHLGKDRDYRTVHFGFRDGIANPTIRNWPTDKPQAERPRFLQEHEAGEFVLGYTNNNGFNSWLLVNPLATPNPWLRPLAPIQPEFFWNGSFGVFRKMAQHEKPFRHWVKKWADSMDPPASEAYVRAKICGRWDDGRVVRPGQSEAGKVPIGELDDFDFSGDRGGEGCPFGSHIRRMNPRDDPVVPSRRRPLIRRGMPFGPALDEDPEEKHERGLLGLFFCASLEDQFEHLLCEWGDANPMGPPNAGTSRDPFTGAYGAAGVFDIPMAGPELRQLDAFRSFVTTKGTVYAFFPGLKGIELLARAPELEG